MTRLLPEETLAYEKEIYDLRQLLEISRALNSMLDFEYLIQAVLDMCLAQVQTLQAALFLASHGVDRDLQMVSGFNWSELAREPDHYTIPAHCRLMKFFHVHHQTVQLSTIDSALEKEPEVGLLKGMGAELIVPLRARGKLIGLIVLGEKAVSSGHYTEKEQNFLIDLAGLAGIAVENARLYEEATTDSMTGLRNFAFFQTRLKEDMDRCNRRGRFLSLVITDVDHFKSFNDTYGHQAGDEVLRSVASLLNESHRKNLEYTAARYGGEEFCLILPGADERTALQEAEQLRESIQGMVVDYAGQKMAVTISAGIVTVDYDELPGLSVAELIARADQALYRAKRGGRNCVLCYSWNEIRADNEASGGGELETDHFHRGGANVGERFENSARSDV